MVGLDLYHMLVSLNNVRDSILPSETTVEPEILKFPEL